ncbi:WD40/YVTN/BNR-like repeat-containing protein [Actinoplanes sp. CA-051413]|uniref:WD40/YVTN/BNR-like repeat-containing protein n=1 Tax=Actinoplanes sp. CA-051413 TaxID=3239899 RepID=UPI003D97DEF2
MRTVTALAVIAALVGVAADPASAASRPTGGGPSWRFTQTATTNRLVIADVVSRSVIWAVGGGETTPVTDGSVVLTTDGGRSWRDVTPPGGATENFRDVMAFGRDEAVVLSTGDGETEPTQIYRTVDGGESWRVVFDDALPAFYNCFAFFDHRRGLAMSDPVGGKFRIAETTNGGRSWRVLPDAGMPPALNGEFGRATGTCLQASGQGYAWFGTTTPAGIDNRVFRTTDGGHTWRVANVPLSGGDDAGVRSLSFQDRRHGIAVGGPFATDTGQAAVTVDGGRTWSPAGSPAGFRNGVTWVPGERSTAIAVGPSGSDISTDDGRHWRHFDDAYLLGVDCAPGAGCWAVGRGGLAARLSLNRRRT